MTAETKNILSLESEWSTCVRKATSTHFFTKQFMSSNACEALREIFTIEPYDSYEQFEKVFELNHRGVNAIIKSMSVRKAISKCRLDVLDQIPIDNHDVRSKIKAQFINVVKEVSLQAIYACGVTVSGESKVKDSLSHDDNS